MENAASIQLVRLTTSGRNALDFALAYYVGRAVTADPTGHFHIVSKDTGFDPLIEHLRSRHIHADRHDDFAPLTALAPVSAPAKPPSAAQEDLLTRASEHLRKLVTNRPKRKKTLISHLRARFDKTASDAAMLDLVDRLSKAGRLTIREKDAVTYHDQVLTF